MKSGNPVLRSDTFDAVPAGERMTVNGTINKTAMMLALVVITAIYTWGRFTSAQNPAAIMPLVWTGAIGGLIFCLITVFKTEWVAVTAPIYALLEGLVVGGLSAIFEVAYPGIVVQAVGLTFGVLAAMLLAYRSGLIQATEKFKLGVIAATGGIALLYLVSMVMSMFGKPIGFIHEGGTFLRPTIVCCDSFDHPLANKEFLCPYASVVQCPQADVLHQIGYSLSVSAITKDEAFIDQIQASRRSSG